MPHISVGIEPVRKGVRKMIDEKKLIENQPTVDAIEVVRCGKCKRWMKDVPGCTEFVGRCEFANYMIGSMGFCSYGERRSDE